MAVTFSSAGTTASGVAGSITVSYPITTTNGQMLLLCVSHKFSRHVLTTPAGWTQLASMSGGIGAEVNDAGPLTTTVLYQVANGTEGGTSVVLNTGGDVITARIYSFNKPVGSGWDIVANTAVDNTPGQYTVTHGNLGAKTGDLLFHSWAVNTNISMFSASFTMAGATLTRSNNAAGGTTSGSNLYVVANRFTINGTGTGDFVYVADAASETADGPTGPAVFIRMRDVVSKRVFIIS